MIDVVPPVKRRGRPAAAGAESSEVQSLDRAVAILEVLAGEDALGLSEIGRRVDLPTSTVHRLLTTLQRRRLVGHDLESGLWMVGVGLFRIGSAYLRLRKLPEIGRPVIRQLQVAVGETVNLSMTDGFDLVCVAQAESHTPVRAFFRLGRRLPIHASAAGKAILAALPAAERGAWLPSAPFPGFSENTLRAPGPLARELERTTARGFAVDDEEHAQGMRCVAGAIFDETRIPIGAVSISAPTVRLPYGRLDELGDQVKAAAAKLTDLYGGLPPQTAPSAPPDF